MIGIDTNVLVRYLAQDDPVQGRLARRFIEEDLTPERRGHISLVALAETVWVLRSRYASTRGEIALTIETLLTSPVLKVQEEAAVWIAVDAYADSRADFADALISAVDHRHGCDHTVTFDRAAAKLEGMQLLQASA